MDKLDFGTSSFPEWKVREALKQKKRKTPIEIETKTEIEEETEENEIER